MNEPRGKIIHVNFTARSQRPGLPPPLPKTKRMSVIAKHRGLVFKLAILGSLAALSLWLF